MRRIRPHRPRSRMSSIRRRVLFLSFPVRIGTVTDGSTSVAPSGRRWLMQRTARRECSSAGAHGLAIARQGAPASCGFLTKLPRLSSRRANATCLRHLDSKWPNPGLSGLHVPRPVPHLSRLRSVAIPCLPGASVDTTPNTIVFESTKISLKGSSSLGK